MSVLVIPSPRGRIGRAGFAWALGVLCAVLLSGPHRSLPLRDVDAPDVSHRKTVADEPVPLVEPQAGPEAAQPQEPDYRLERVEIERNFLSAVQRVGVSTAVATMLASAFAHEVDFRRDLKRGNGVKFIFPRSQQRDGKPADSDSGATPGDAPLPVAVRIEIGARTHDVFLFRDGDGNVSYRPKQGVARAPASPRYPVAFQRISSHFSPRRLHPVTLQWRAHEGVDFAAPSGTPVYAPADGKVLFAGRQTGYGNLVKLGHAREYSTLYAHLAGFAGGVRAGGSVRQGDLIGYVGSTGWSTGPHLHYEVRVNGVPRDPLKAELPRAEPNVPISTAAVESFRKETDRLTALF